jgi:hypothetical protein
MYGYNKKNSCRVLRQGTAGSGSGVQRERSRSQGYEEQAAAERRGQAAACVQEMQPVHLPLSATRSKEPVPHVDVSDSSSAGERWRRRAGDVAHVEVQKQDGPSFSTAPPRSCIPAGVLNWARAQEARSATADGQLLGVQACRPTAGAAEAQESPHESSGATTLRPPLPPPPAAAVPVAGLCAQASYLMALAGGLLREAAIGALGQARHGKARAGEEAWHAGAEWQTTPQRRAHARGGEAHSLAHTRVALQGQAGKHEQGSP